MANQFFLSVGNATLQAAQLAAHPSTANAAVVTFTDGSRALVSTNLEKGYFQPTVVNGQPGVLPTFLSETGLLMAG